MRPRIRALVVAAICCGAGLQPGWPAAARPKVGAPAVRETAAPDPPRRIVSLVPAATEMLFAMGEGGRLVGVSSYDRFPPDASRLPRIGGLLDPDVERLLALTPDLAIVYATQTDLRRQLDRAGVRMFVNVHGDLADIPRTIRSLGVIVGAEPASGALADRIESQLAAIRARVAGRPRPRTLLVLGREAGSLRNAYASGGSGFLHDMLEIAGGADVLADLHRQSVSVGAEMILARAPEVIIELHYGASVVAEQIDAERRVWDRLPAVPAVRQGRVYLLVGDEFVVPGPRVVQATERLARVLHPEAWAR